MQTIVNMIICSLAWLILALLCCSEPASTENIPRTSRNNNKAFGSTDELRSYLDELSQYYAVIGRPRFGKRTLLPSRTSLPSSIGASLKEPISYRFGAAQVAGPIENAAEPFQLFYPVENDAS